MLLLLSPAFALDPWPTSVRVVDADSLTSVRLVAQVAWTGEDRDALAVGLCEEDPDPSTPWSPTDLEGAVAAQLGPPSGAGLAWADGLVDAEPWITGLMATQGGSLAPTVFTDDCDTLPTQSVLDGLSSATWLAALAEQAALEACVERSREVTCALDDLLSSGQTEPDEQCLGSDVVDYFGSSSGSYDLDRRRECASSCPDGLENARAAIDAIRHQRAECEAVVATQEQALADAEMAIACNALPDGADLPPECSASCVYMTDHAVTAAAQLLSDAVRIGYEGESLLGDVENGVDNCSVEQVALDCTCEDRDTHSESPTAYAGEYPSGRVLDLQVARLTAGLRTSAASLARDESAPILGLADAIDALPSEEIAWYVRTDGGDVQEASVVYGAGAAGPDLVVLSTARDVVSDLVPVADYWGTAGAAALALLDRDADGDGVPDDEDVCPGFDDLEDGDGDYLPDGCDDDDDDDGVLDTADTCPDTTLGAPVLTSGCSLDQACPCAGTWANHGAWQRCEEQGIDTLARAGRISSAEKQRLKRAAASSRCGG